MLTRRHLLQHGLTLGAASGLAPLLQLGFARRAAAQEATGDYRALVCILLAGGNDSFNMLVPWDTGAYADYAAMRSDLALPRDSLLPLAGSDSDGRRYALHPGMPGLQQLFAAGDAATLSNVGPLVVPLDTAAVAAGSWPVPLGLLSHADQIQQWQTAVSDARIAQGWGGRIADLVQGASPLNGLSMNISLSGNNVFQSGQVTTPYSVTTADAGAVSLNGYTDDTPGGEFTRGVVDALLAADQRQLLRREYRNRFAEALATQQTVASALASATPLATAFADNDFAQSLRQIARLISVREQLGATRQTFFVTVGGWDHHDGLLENQAAMLPMIDAGLLAFRDALTELDALSLVTTFTSSDFGRTLTSNGKGSDHGWGGHHVIMGGAVNGGQFYGEYPDLSPDNPLDVGRGVYIPTTATDLYFAELVRWFGVSDSDLDQVLPNLGRFYSPSQGAPLGFMLPG
ncbi:MAG: DUF1501 domain-containing protein [Haliea sp.]|uniref:DUF1501 domain-containing protein n=1 Tax=Haliea sp. TaxID=1932666 RepID=UPI0032EEEBCF